MRNAILNRALVLLLAAVLAACTLSAQALHMPPHEKVVLKNGMTLLLMEKQGVPMVNFYAIVKAGSAADPAKEAGLASTTAGLLRKGTKDRTAQQFAADLDFIGGSFDAGAGSDFSGISAEFMTKDLDRGLDLFCDALLRPTFPQAEVDKLLAQSLDGVRAAKDQPEAVLGPYFYGYLFGTHPYGRPEGGDEISLKRIQRDAIVSFYESYYVPSNTILAVSGEFDPAAMKKKLEEAFGGWQGKAAPPVSIPAAITAKGTRLLLVDKPDATQTYFAIGNVGTTVTDPDRVALRVVNTVFGGRFTSLLNEALRVESGYSYGAESEFDSRKMPGAFLMASFTKNETTVPAIDLALKVLDDFRKNGVTSEQLASAKSYIKGQFPPSLETSGQLARRIALNEFYGLGDDEVNQLGARIDAVTPEIAKRVIENHYPQDNLVFLLIGKASEIAPAVKKYAAQQDARKISDPGYWPPEKP
jgi:zinc protease